MTPAELTKALTDIDNLAAESRRLTTLAQAAMQKAHATDEANRRQLEAFDGLLAAMETFTDEVEALHRIAGPHPCRAATCPDIDAARAAIAAAKPHTPDAPGN